MPQPVCALASQRQVFCKECSIESAGGQRRPPLRRGWNACVGRATARVAPTEDYKRCGAKRNPPVTASPCQPPLGKGAEGTGEADCHSQCANWLRNDRALQGVRWLVGGGTHGSRPTRIFVGQGPCALPGVQHKTDGRTEASAPTEALQGVR